MPVKFPNGLPKKFVYLSREYIIRKILRSFQYSFLYFYTNFLKNIKKLHFNTLIHKRTKFAQSIKLDPFIC